MLSTYFPGFNSEDQIGQQFIVYHAYRSGFHQDRLDNAPGNYQLWLKDDLKKSEKWEATFTANGLNSIMASIVKETGISKEVEGKNYSDVIMLEAESKINMNGNVISTNFFTKYYYTKVVGLIMTTSSMVMCMHW